MGIAIQNSICKEVCMKIEFLKNFWIKLKVISEYSLIHFFSGKIENGYQNII